MKNILVILAFCILAIPGCFQQHKKNSINTEHKKYTKQQETIAYNQSILPQDKEFLFQEVFDNQSMDQAEQLALSDAQEDIEQLYSALAKNQAIENQEEENDLLTEYELTEEERKILELDELDELNELHAEESVKKASLAQEIETRSNQETFTEEEQIS